MEGGTDKCAHGGVALYPVANVEMQVDGLQVKAEAVVSRRLPMSVKLGKNVPEFDQLLGRTESSARSQI